MGFLAGVATAFTLGFIPFAEIYVAVPAGVVAGLPVPWAVVFAVVGNLLPIPLVLLAYEQLVRIPRLGPWLEHKVTGRMRDRVQQAGFWSLLLLTPWLGTWVTAAAGRLAGVSRGRLVTAMCLSVILYGVGLGIILELGLDVFGIETA